MFEPEYVYIYFDKVKYSQDEEELMSTLVLEKNNPMKKINNGEAMLSDSEFKENILNLMLNTTRKIKQFQILKYLMNT